MKFWPTSNVGERNRSDDGAEAPGSGCQHPASCHPWNACSKPAWVYENSAAFYAPDVCFDDARKYLSVIAQERKFNPLPGLAVLEEIARIVESVEVSLYAEFEAPARLRIATRDPDDWPIVATSLLLDCPVWTEDQDFFGSGVATWTTRTVELFLRDS
jgi:predicted nucleic acid-binding protein